MTRRLNLPDSASVASAQADGRLFAPSAARNADAICDLVAAYAPPTGNALEIASGTGQHIVQLSARMPGINWQPTDVDPARIDSIAHYVKGAKQPNILPPISLDATNAGWGKHHPPQDLILLVNLLHLISTAEATTLIKEAANALAPGGTFILYGPFKRAGDLTSDGDAKFHQSLTTQDPEIGYKDDFDIIELLQNAWLDLTAVIEMPANNLAFIARKPA